MVSLFLSWIGEAPALSSRGRHWVRLKRIKSSAAQYQYCNTSMLVSMFDFWLPPDDNWWRRAVRSSAGVAFTWPRWGTTDSLCLVSMDGQNMICFSQINMCLLGADAEPDFDLPETTFSQRERPPPVIWLFFEFMIPVWTQTKAVFETWRCTDRKLFDF